MFLQQRKLAVSSESRRNYIAPNESKWSHVQCPARLLPPLRHAYLCTNLTGYALPVEIRRIAVFVWHNPSLPWSGIPARLMLTLRAKKLSSRFSPQEQPTGSIKSRRVVLVAKWVRVPKKSSLVLAWPLERKRATIRLVFQFRQSYVGTSKCMCE